MNIESVPSTSLTFQSLGFFFPLASRSTWIFLMVPKESNATMGKVMSLLARVHSVSLGTLR